MLKKALMIIILVVIFSCKKEDNSLQELSDSIRGQYELVSATIQGEGVDINWDGVSSNDLIAEFQPCFDRNIVYGNCIIALDSRIRVREIKKYEIDYLIDFYIPIQAIDKLSSDGSYVLSESENNGRYKSFSLTINVNRMNTIEYGNIFCWSEFSPYQELDRSVCVDYDGCYIESIQFIDDGAITMVAHHSFLNFSTGQLVERKVHYLYRRITYAV